MKIKVISPFQDIVTKQMRNIEDEFEVTEERGINLIERNLAVKVEDEIIEEGPLSEEEVTEETAEEVVEEETTEVEEKQEIVEEKTEEKPKKSKKGE